MKLAALLALFGLSVLAWLIFRYALPHDDESIGLPNVEWEGW